MYGDKLEAR